MTRDAQGRRVVTARTTAGISIGAIVAVIGIMLKLADWSGVPSPKQYREDIRAVRDRMARIERALDGVATAEDIMGLKDAVNDLDRRFGDTNRRLEAFGITDAEISRRLLEKR